MRHGYLNTFLKLVVVIVLMITSRAALAQTLLQCNETAATSITFEKKKARRFLGKVLKWSKTNRLKFLSSKGGKTAMLFGNTDPSSAVKLVALRVSRSKRVYVEVTSGGTVILWTYYPGKVGILVAQKTYAFLDGPPAVYTYMYKCGLAK